jgi:hypothetical protein
MPIGNGGILKKKANGRSEQNYIDGWYAKRLRSLVVVLHLEKRKLPLLG